MVAGMAILIGGPMGAAGVIATGILLSGGGPIGLGAGKFKYFIFLN